MAIVLVHEYYICFTNTLGNSSSHILPLKEDGHFLLDRSLFIDILEEGEDWKIGQQETFHHSFSWKKFRKILLPAR